MSQVDIAMIVSLAGKVGGWVGAHLTQVVVLLIVATIVAWGSVTIDDWMEPERERGTKPDTVQVERTIMKRDTVTETVPRTVRVFDTVKTTDTMRVAVPMNYDYMGTISSRPVDVSEDKVTLTYFSDGRHVQNEYSIPTERNRVSLWGSASTLPDMAVVASGLAYRRDTGWGELEVSAGYAVTPAGRGGVVSVSVSTGYEW